MSVNNDIGKLVEELVCSRCNVKCSIDGVDYPKCPFDDGSLERTVEKICEIILHGRPPL